MKQWTRWMERTAWIAALALTATFAAVGDDEEKRPPIQADEVAGLEFLAPDTAADWLRDGDDFYTGMQWQELVARMQNDDQEETGVMHAEWRRYIRHRYAKAPVAFTDAEKKLVTAFVDDLHSELSGAYPAVFAGPWRLVKLGGDEETGEQIEDGEVFTLHDIIFLPAPLLEAMLHYADHDGAERLMFYDTLLDARLRVLQRDDPERFESLYAAWGFVQADVAMTEAIEARQRLTPDTAVRDWIVPLPEGEFAEAFWPQLFFNRTRDPELDDVGEYAVAVAPDAENEGGYRPVVSGNGALRVRPLGRMADFVKRFGPTEQVFHPRLIAADQFSRAAVLEAFVTDAMLADADKDRAELEAELEPARSWFKENLK